MFFFFTILRLPTKVGTTRERIQAVEMPTRAHPDDTYGYLVTSTTPEPIFVQANFSPANQIKMILPHQLEEFKSTLVTVENPQTD